MEELIRNQGIVAMEMRVPYNPVIHNLKAMANYQYLDGKFCKGKLMSEIKSAIIILLDMELGRN